MVSLRHLNIVAYYGRCLAPPCIITEYCSRGSLACVLAAARADGRVAAALTWRRRLSLVRALLATDQVSQRATGSHEGRRAGAAPRALASHSGGTLMAGSARNRVQRSLFRNTRAPPPLDAAGPGRKPGHVLPALAALHTPRPEDAQPGARPRVLRSARRTSHLAAPGWMSCMHAHAAQLALCAGSALAHQAASSSHTPATHLSRLAPSLPLPAARGRKLALQGCGYAQPAPAGSRWDARRFPPACLPGCRKDHTGRMVPRCWQTSAA